MQQRVLLGLLLVISPWLLVHGPGNHVPRSWALAWQLGHVVLFFVAAGWWLGRRPLRGSWWFALATVIAGTLLLGGLVEVVQHYTGGDSSWSDLRLDTCGAVLAVSLLSPAARIHRIALLAPVTVLLLVLDVWPLGVAMLDEYRQRRDFPVLADFESRFEAGRWEVNGRKQIVEDETAHSRVLQIVLAPAKYPGFFMTRLPRDWSSYRRLSFAVRAPEGVGVRLECRVHDFAHEVDNRFSDRFNRSYDLGPGWNRVQIPLQDLRSAPQARAMDLTRIATVGCFVVDLGAPLRLFVDEFRLD